MSNSDYTIRGTGDLCPVATLSAAVTPSDIRLNLEDYSMVPGNNIVIGSAVMVQGEIGRITDYEDGWIEIARGCADTIPKAHPAGVPVWFFDNATGSDEVEYVMAETLSVKLLPVTASIVMGVAASPPNQIQFVGRAGRPYPPGKMLVNTVAWYSTTFYLDNTNEALMLSWANRNRVVQGDVLVGHEAGDITPEEGTTYTLEIYDASNNLKRTASGLTGTAFAYYRGEMIADFAPPTGTTRNGYAIFYSMRDGLKSKETYRINFTFQTTPGGAVSGVAFPQTWSYVPIGVSDLGWLLYGAKYNAGTSTYSRAYFKATNPEGPYTTLFADTGAVPGGFTPSNHYVQAGDSFYDLALTGASPYRMVRQRRNLSAVAEIGSTNIPSGEVPICFGYDGTDFWAICSANRVYKSADSLAWVYQGTIAPGILPALIGHDGTLGHVRPLLRRVGSRWLLIFSNGGVFINTTATLITGWVAATTQPNTGTLEGKLWDTGGKLYVATRPAGSGNPRLWSSTDSGTNWTVDPYTFPQSTGFETPVSWQGGDTFLIAEVYATGTGPTDKLRVYNGRQVLHERENGGTTWTTASAKTANLYRLWSYNGKAYAEDNGISPSAGIYGPPQVRYPAVADGVMVAIPLT